LLSQIEKSTKKKTKIVVIFKRKERSKLSIFSKMDIQNEQKTNKQTIEIEQLNIFNKKKTNAQN